jgi:23S rRNA (guanosine2251-2'-O)-methyltransferase
MRKLKNNELIRKTNEEFKDAKKTPLILILDNVRSLNNIGSVFRTADAFLIEKIYLCGITAKPPHKDIHKTALGATDSVNWEYFSSTLEVIKILQEKQCEIYAIEQTENSIPLNKFYPKKNKTHAFILGNEINGVTQEAITLVEKSIEIPQLGTKHSLNISVACGIVVWQFFAKI